MRRREFVNLLVGAAATWPLAARAQQVPVIGFLHSGYLGPSNRNVAGFRRGLNESGYIEGRNVAIEYRWAKGQYDRLPGLAADLVSRQVAVILAAGGSEPGRVAKAATTTIPIVFESGADPIAAGLVASLNRPGGNVTGVSLMGTALEAKRLEVLHELAPKAAAIAVLINPNYPAAKSQSEELQAAAAHLGVTPIMLTASTEADIDAAFTILAQRGAGALLVSQDPFLGSQSAKLVVLAAGRGLPTIYPFRDFTAAGGLVSYGTDFAEGYRQAGIYVGKILKGIKPAELPVMQPTKFELVINSRTAKMLGLELPDRLIALADEVLE